MMLHRMGTIAHPTSKLPKGPPMTAPTPLQELRAAIALPLESARAMPKSVYTSADFAALEQRHIFAAEWLCAGRAEALPNPGDYLTMEIAGEPVIILRDTDGQIGALSNVCRHRMSILLQGRGHIRTLTCPYHAWTYNLDGTLRGAPAMTRNASFCKADIALPVIRSEVWQGWIMVTLSPDAPPPSQTLGAVVALTAPIDMSTYSETFRETFRWNTNWKVLAENFMESYHLPACHAGTIGGASNLADMVCPPGTLTYNYHTILKNDLVPNLPFMAPIDTIYFYGAGCEAVGNKAKVSEAFKKAMPNTKVIVEHDLLAAAKALWALREAFSASLRQIAITQSPIYLSTSP